MSGLNRFFIGILLGTALLFAAVPESSAHTSLISSAPEAQSRIEGMWNEISLQFDEDLISIGDKEPNRISVIDSNGDNVPVGITTVIGSVVRAPIDTRKMKTGLYTVRYRVVSGDGHVVNSEFTVSFIKKEEAVAHSPSSATSVEASAATLEEVTESQIETTSPTLKLHKDHSSFLHLHRDHILLILLAALSIGFWTLYRRRNS